MFKKQQVNFLRGKFYLNTGFCEFRVSKMCIILNILLRLLCWNCNGDHHLRSCPTLPSGKIMVSQLPYYKKPPASSRPAKARKQSNRKMATVLIEKNYGNFKFWSSLIHFILLAFWYLVRFQNVVHFFCSLSNCLFPIKF